jgi:hypothetical protein
MECLGSSIDKRLLCGSTARVHSLADLGRVGSRHAKIQRRHKFHMFITLGGNKEAIRAPFFKSPEKPKIGENLHLFVLQ